LTPTTLYVGAGDGVFKSTDGGGSWSAANTGLPSGNYGLVIDPATPTTLYAGTFYGSVFKSTDGGGSWKAFPGLTNTYIQALAIDPKNSARLYAGTWGGGVFSIMQAEVKSQVYLPDVRFGP